MCGNVFSGGRGKASEEGTRSIGKWRESKRENEKRERNETDLVISASPVAVSNILCVCGTSGLQLLLQ
jgi:hypothetical protein